MDGKTSCWDIMVVVSESILWVPVDDPCWDAVIRCVFMVGEVPMAMHCYVIRVVRHIWPLAEAGATQHRLMDSWQRPVITEKSSIVILSPVRMLV